MEVQFSEQGLVLKHPAIANPRNVSRNPEKIVNKIKNQHFVPRFYLEKFTDSDGKIYAFDFRTKNQFETSVDNIANQKYFYDYEPIDSILGDQTIEKLLSKFESDIAIVFSRIIDQLNKGNIEDPSHNNRIELARFILIQQSRTEESRTLSRHALLEAERQLLAKSATKEFIGSYGLTPKNHDAKLDQIRSFITLDNDDVVNELCDRYWVYWRNNTDSLFYTSDHPVVGHIHEDLNMNAYEIFFPLTPTLAVSILLKDQFPTWAGMNNKIVELNNPEFIKFYNGLIIHNCNRQVYNSSNELDLAKAILLQKPELSNPDRQRFAKM
ncbi:MAG: DUF4238 domain-containing protein [Bacteroidetes bacterium]|nr:DUF4238 domain-containing protein [Bacteroidota bacterium]